MEGEKCKFCNEYTILFNLNFSTIFKFGMKSFVCVCLIKQKKAQI